MRHDRLFHLAAVLALAAGRLPAQSVTIGGTVSDSVTAAPIDSARVVVIHASNPSLRHTVFTDISGAWSLSFIPASAPEDPLLPGRLALDQNYPNPFNPSTTITFSLPAAARVTLSVYTVLGQLLDRRTAELGAGGYSVAWKSRGAGGVLFYELRTGEERAVRRMVQLDGGSGGGLGEFVAGAAVPVSAPGGAMAADPYRVIVSRYDYRADSSLVVPVPGLNVRTLLQSTHRAAFVMDFHNDVLEKAVTGYQLGLRNSINHSDVPRFRDGGVDAQMMAVWVNPAAYPNTAFQRAMQMIDTFDVQVARYSSMLSRARSEEEILQAAAAGKFAAMLAVEGGHAIQDNLANLRSLHARGVRSMTITWNNSTSWATAASDPQSTTRGLSPFGFEVIRLMDSLGMVIDVAHTGIKTIEDILATTRNPVVDSHAGARALRNHYRNLTDSQMVALARTGGVVGVVFYPPFLTTATATIDTVVRHIEYIRALVGVDHVALGSDFDGIEQTVVGLENVTRFPSLSRALLRRGWTEEDLRKLLGGNMLRVIRQVCRP